MTVTPEIRHSSSAQRLRLAFGWPLAHASGYLALDILAGTVTFSVMVTLLSLSVGLGVTLLLAIPSAWLALTAGRALGTAERRRHHAFFGERLASPHGSPTATTWLGRLVEQGKQRSTWREFGYHLVLLPLGAVSLVVVCVTWTLPLALIGLPAYINALPSGRWDLWFTSIDSPLEATIPAPLGLMLLAAMPWTIMGWTEIRRAITRRLLGPQEGDGLRERVVELETSRTRVVDAAEDERRRIERNLHDGAQQRLVSLAMNLGRARERLTSHPEDAHAMIGEAHDEAKLVLSEIRDLARGIYPAILKDRGLDAALSSVAARCAVPVEVRVDLPERPPERIEGAAYFFVSEALANVAKHSGATRAWVAIARHGNRLVVEVRDNGRGGADPNGGSGLRGLVDRVASVDGWMNIASPPGGPTTLTAELPCAS